MSTELVFDCEYKQIIKEAGHDHIKSGEQGLQTFEYERWNNE